MYKAIRQLDFIPEEFQGEQNIGESETVPNQALSVKEVLIKFSQGTLGSIGLPMHYDYEKPIDINDDVFDSYNPTLSPDFDLTDAEEYLRTINEQKQLKKDLNTAELESEKNFRTENETKPEE